MKSIACDPLVYTIDHSGFIETNFHWFKWLKGVPIVSRTERTTSLGPEYIRKCDRFNIRLFNYIAYQNAFGVIKQVWVRVSN